MNNKSDIMNAKKGNTIYLIFIISTAVMLIFFICMGVYEKSNSYGVDYETVLDYGDNSYKIKVCNAAYLKDKNALSFVILSKPSSETQQPTSSKPYISGCTVFGKKKDNQIDVDTIKVENKSDIVQTFTIENVNEDISYLSMLISIKYADYTDPDTVDEFGQIHKGEKHEGEEKTELVQVDVSDIKFMVSGDYNKEIAEVVKQSADFEKENENTSKTQQTTVTTSVAVTESKKAETTAPQKHKSTSAQTTAPVAETEEPIGGYEPSEEPSQNIPQSSEVTSPPEQTEPVPDTTVKQTEVQTQAETSKVTEHSASTTKPKTAQTKETTRQTKPQVINVNDVEIVPGNLTLEVGKSYVLIAKVYPYNAKNKGVKWESYRPDIASVSSTGTVKAVSTGTAMITVTTIDGDYSATCMVNVVEGQNEY